MCHLSPVKPVCFWLVVTFLLVFGSHLRPLCIFVLDFSVAQFDGPNNEITSHPIVILLYTISPSYIISLRPTFGWMLCPPFQWQPSKPKAPSFSLFLFFGCTIWPPNDGITAHSFVIAQRVVSPTSPPLLPPTFSWGPADGVHQCGGAAVNVCVAGVNLHADQRQWLRRQRADSGGGGGVGNVATK